VDTRTALQFAESELLQALPEPYFSQLVAGVRAAHATTPGGVADLARGNPEVPPPPHVIAALIEASQRLDVHGYPPFAGMPALREACVRHQAEVFGVELDPATEVVVVPGTKTAIALCAMALANSGDAILMPDPGYADYPSGIGVARARKVSLPLDASAEFAPDWGAVPAADLGAATMAFLNYPANPCGTVAGDDVFPTAIEMAHRHSIAIVHDLAYGELRFDRRAPQSFLATPGAKDVGVELVSMSKTWCMAGWRVGFVCGNAELVARVQTLLDHLTVGVFMPLQLAAVAALDGPQDSVEQLRVTYGDRQKRVAEALGIPMSPASYYTWLKLPNRLTCGDLLTTYRVALAPGEGFGPRGEGWARLSVAVDDATLDKGLQRLAAAFGDYSVATASSTGASAST
jgi:aminotransferase